MPIRAQGGQHGIFCTAMGEDAGNAAGDHDELGSYDPEVPDQGTPEVPRAPSLVPAHWELISKHSTSGTIALVEQN